MMNKWSDILPKESLELAQRLADKAAEERMAGKVIFPPQEDIFRALELTPPEAVRCAVVSQDPYFLKGYANGLAFSVHKGVTLPRSLKNIFKELHDDIGCDIPQHGDLTAWAERGVLMLNSVLTVEEGKPNSHAKWGWQDFVHEVVRAGTNLPQPIVFILWGGQARAFVADLQLSSMWEQKKTSIWSSHPSPLGATRGNEAVPAFIGSRPFSTANKLLVQMGGEPIDWTLV